MEHGLKHSKTQLDLPSMAKTLVAPSVLQSLWPIAVGAGIRSVPLTFLKMSTCVIISLLKRL